MLSDTYHKRIIENIFIIIQILIIHGFPFSGRYFFDFCCGKLDNSPKLKKVTRIIWTFFVILEMIIIQDVP